MIAIPRDGARASPQSGPRSERGRRPVDQMQFLRRFSHPNVLALLGVSENTRPLMLITEYGDTNLEAVLQRQIMLPLWRRLEFAYDFAMVRVRRPPRDRPRSVHGDLADANRSSRASSTSTNRRSSTGT